MGHAPGSESEADVRRMLSAARSGNDRPLWEALEEYRDRLRRIVSVRLHPGLQGRVDASDVVQESLLEVSQRLDKFLDDENLPFFVWVRLITLQKLQQLHRFHLGAQARDARRERRADAGHVAASTLHLAGNLVASGLSPSQHLAEEEQKARLQQVLDGLSPNDLEIIALRHLEELSNAEAAQVLGLEESTASRRYRRTILKIKSRLERIPE